MRTAVQSVISEIEALRPSAASLMATDIKEVRSHGNFFVSPLPPLDKFIYKLCDNPDGRVPDIIRREVFASLVLTSLGCNVPKSWLFQHRDTLDLRFLYSKWEAPADRIQDEFVVMERLNGVSVARMVSQHQGTQRIQEQLGMSSSKCVDLLVASYWLGDEDRGLEDVMIVDDQWYFIDFGLSGPGRSDRIRSAHPEPQCYHHKQKTLRCYGGKGISFIEFVSKVYEDLIDRINRSIMVQEIEGIAQEEIMLAVEYSQLDNQVTETLLRRQEALRQDIVEWCEDLEQYLNRPIA